MDTAIKYSNIYLEIPACVIGVEELKIVEELNEHGKAFAVILTDDKDKFELMNKLNTSVEVKISFKKEDRVNEAFVGLPTKVMIKGVEDIFHVELELKSKSFVLDFKKKKRSFQNINNPYSNLFKQVVEEYPGASVFDRASNGALQGVPMIMYEETAYEFLKRTASRLGAKLVTNVRSQRPMISIGKQGGSDFDQKTIEYLITNEAGNFLKAEINYGNWKREEKIHYTIESIYEYNLYDKLIYENIKFTVVKKETRLVRGIIVFTYWLLKEGGVKQDLIVNDRIQGALIEGKVLDVSVDRVKLHLVIDKEQSVNEAYFYKCGTLYANEGSTGFYSSFEKGERVFLYLPKGDLEEGYVIHSKRLDGDTNIKTQDPRVKYYSNNEGKELMLSPSEFQVTTTNGMILINMDEKDGIEITSSDDIIIKTNDWAEIKGKEIALRAGSEILLATKSSNIIVDENIDFKAMGVVIGV